MPSPPIRSSFVLISAIISSPPLVSSGFGGSM
nr:MAG TPA: hypothetical protein [Caudoviricetes sp.]